MAAVYGSQSSIPNYYNDAPDRPLFGESRPRVSKEGYFRLYLSLLLCLFCCIVVLLKCNLVKFKCLI